MILNSWDIHHGDWYIVEFRPTLSLPYDEVVRAHTRPGGLKLVTIDKPKRWRWLGPHIVDADSFVEPFPMTTYG